jgi:hypothetical protein
MPQVRTLLRTYRWFRSKQAGVGDQVLTEVTNRRVDSQQLSPAYLATTACD